MFFFGEKSNLDFAACIHKAHLVSKNVEEFCCHLFFVELTFQLKFCKIFKCKLLGCYFISFFFIYIKRKFNLQ